jgi:hypothetical protein
MYNDTILYIFIATSFSAGAAQKTSDYATPVETEIDG